MLSGNGGERDVIAPPQGLHDHNPHYGQYDQRPHPAPIATLPAPQTSVPFPASAPAYIEAFLATGNTPPGVPWCTNVAGVKPPGLHVADHELDWRPLLGIGPNMGRRLTEPEIRSLVLLEEELEEELGREEALLRPPGAAWS